MRRARRPKSSVGVSLFPFLAVLICTMGALIVLLVIVVEQARVHATEIADQRRAVQRERNAESETLNEQLRKVQQHRTALEKRRTEIADQLSRRGAELSHLEDHIRRLKRRGEELQSQARRLQEEETDRTNSADLLAADLAQAEAALEIAQGKLAKARREAAARSQSYAIVPYEGLRGTSRRPIFIECTDTGIILQPEGIVLTPADFEGPLGPGNPLDAALRATREYLARHASADGGEPYPLLIVRPDGAVAYALARTAMSNWDDEFGYELVEADVDLAFPKPDSQLQMLLAEAVSDARRRQKLLASAAPSRFRGGVAATGRRGGFTQVSGGRGAGAGGGDTEAIAAGTATKRFSESVPDLNGDEGLPEHDSPYVARSAVGGHRSKDAGAAEAAAGTRYGAGGESKQGGTAPSADVQPLAKAKGRNWALPESSRGIGITRPIHVVCRREELIIMPDRGGAAGAKRISLDGSMSRAVDRFIAGVWDHMSGWGIAVAGGHWKPVLRVEVAPGAEQRYDELAALLQESGMVVERR